MHPDRVVVRSVSLEDEALNGNRWDRYQPCTDDTWMIARPSRSGPGFDPDRDALSNKVFLLRQRLLKLAGSRSLRHKLEGLDKNRLDRTVLAMRLFK